MELASNMKIIPASEDLKMRSVLFVQMYKSASVSMCSYHYSSPGIKLHATLKCTQVLCKCILDPGEKGGEVREVIQWAIWRGSTEKVRGGGWGTSVILMVCERVEKNLFRIA